MLGNSKWSNTVDINPSYFVREDRLGTAYFEDKLHESKILGHEVAIILALDLKTVNIRHHTSQFPFFELFFSPSFNKEQTFDE